MNHQASEPQSSTRPTPSTPSELAAIQRDDEARLIEGLDLSTKARAVYLYADELQLSIHELVTLSFAQIRRAEYSLEMLIKAEQRSNSHRSNLDALYHWCVASGGLTSVRLTLQAMLETACDAGLWKTCPPWGLHTQQQDDVGMGTVEQRLCELMHLRRKGLISNEEFQLLRADALGLRRPENCAASTDHEPSTASAAASGPN